MAEDSGLVVDALGGEPGVRSARFLRPDASYAERFAEIYRRLAARPAEPRTARFICALAVVRRRRAAVSKPPARIEGEISDEPRGSGGFGYDPIFHYPPYGRTLAEVTDAEKLRVAHRGMRSGSLANGCLHGRPEGRPLRVQGRNVERRTLAFSVPSPRVLAASGTIPPGFAGAGRGGPSVLRLVRQDLHRPAWRVNFISSYQAVRPHRVGPHKRSIPGAEEKLGFDKRRQQRIAGRAIESPQPLRLCRRQPEARHLDVLALHTPKHVERLFVVLTWVTPVGLSEVEPTFDGVYEQLGCHYEQLWWRRIMNRAWNRRINSEEYPDLFL